MNEDDPTLQNQQAAPSAAVPTVVQQTPPAPASNPAAAAFGTQGADPSAAAAAVASAVPYATARAPADAAAAFSSGSPRPADATKFDESLVAGLPPEAASAVRENFDANLAAARDAVEGRARSRASASSGRRDAIADYTSRLLAEAAAPPKQPPQPQPSADPGFRPVSARSKPPPLDANGIPDDGLSFFDDFFA